MTAAAPIFVLATGMRSGSTLLQRLIAASGDVLMWGESGGALDRLAEALACYRDQLGPPGDRWTRGDKGGAQYERFRAAGKGRPHLWIANMNPPEATLLDGLRAFLDAAYGATARELGYATWGVKLVRSGIETARFLRDLYPAARFVFLVRHPLDSLRSIKQHDWDGLRVLDPLGHYARRWERLAVDFRRFEGAHLLRYEDLVGDPHAVRAVGAHLGLRLPESFVGESRVDGWRATRRSDLTWLERLRARGLTRDGRRQWRYDWPRGAA